MNDEMNRGRPAPSGARATGGIDAPLGTGAGAPAGPGALLRDLGARLAALSERAAATALRKGMAAVVRSNRSSSGDGWVTRGGVRLSRAVTIDASPEHLYEVWGDLGRLPSVMSHIERVETLDVGISRWHARAPAGGTVTWTAEVVTDVPGQRIAWRTRPGSDVRHEGEVRFEPAPAGQGTEVHVDLRYWPPAGQLGATVARLLGEEPRQQLADDLRHLREVLETGSRARSAAPLDEPRLLQRPSQPVFVGRS